MDDFPGSATALVAGRALAHNFAHAAEPASPPPPPMPPINPPMMPPPPPLPYVLSTKVPVLALGSVLALMGVVKLVLLRKGKGKSKSGGGGSEGEGAAEGGGDGGGSGEIGPENGPSALNRRGCTDFCCVILFVMFWLGMIYLLYLGATVGDPYMVLYGKDYLGNRCGRGNFTSRKRVIFPRIEQDVLEQSAIASTQPWKLKFYGICVAECPNVQDPTVCFGNPDACMTYDYGTEKQWRAAGGSRYYYSVMPTISIINRCIPIVNKLESGPPAKCAYPICDNVTNPWMVCDAEFPSLWMPQDASQRARCEIKYEENEVTALATERPSPLVDRIADKMGSAQVIVEGILDAQHELLVWGVLVPIGLGFTWLILLRFFAKVVIYGTLIALWCGLAAVTLYLFVITGLAQDLIDGLMASNATRALIGTAVGAVGGGGGGAWNASAGGGNASEAASGDSGAWDDAAAGALSDADAMFSRLIPDDLEAQAAAAQADNPMLYTIAAWAALVLTLVYLVGMVVMRKKIALCAALVKEASLVIKDRPLHVLFPFGTLGFAVGHLAFFLIGMLFLSTAEITPDHFTGAAEALTARATFAQAVAALNSTAQSLGGGREEIAPEFALLGGLLTFKNCVYLYFLFGFLWTNQLINNVAFTSLSGSYCHWYFFRRDQKQQTRFPLAWSTYRVFRYHLGSIAFGSFIVALIQLARILGEILDRQTKKLQETNRMMKLAIKCLKLCLLCLEKTVKFITRYCYIYVAMQGTGFCRSCFAVFSLITSNLAQLAINTLVGLILYVVQLVGIPAACYQFGTVALKGKGAAEPFYPALAIAFMALIIANCFAVVFACVLDTLFVCCVRDKAEYKAAFMSDQLYTAFGFDPAERGGGGGGEGGGGGDGGGKGDGGGGETKQEI